MTTLYALLSFDVQHPSEFQRRGDQLAEVPDVEVEMRLCARRRARKALTELFAAWCADIEDGLRERPTEQETAAAVAALLAGREVA